MVWPFPQLSLIGRHAAATEDEFADTGNRADLYASADTTHSFCEAVATLINEEAKVKSCGQPTAGYYDMSL